MLIVVYIIKLSTCYVRGDNACEFLESEMVCARPSKFYQWQSSFVWIPA